MNRASIAGAVGRDGKATEGLSIIDEALARFERNEERWCVDRQEVLPNIPTVGEYVPGYEAITWGGIGAPKSAPAEIVEKLNKGINAALADPAMSRRSNLAGDEAPVRRHKLATVPRERYHHGVDKHAHAGRHLTRKTQFDDWECRDQLRAGGAEYRDGFAALHGSLQALANAVAAWADYSYGHAACLLAQHRSRTPASIPPMGEQIMALGGMRRPGRAGSGGIAVARSGFRLTCEHDADGGRVTASACSVFAVTAILPSRRGRPLEPIRGRLA